MHKGQLLALLALSLGFSGQSWATLAQLKQVSSQENCGPYATELLEEKAYDELGRGTIGESLRVFFDAFNLQANASGSFQRKCRLNTAIAVPSGFRFRPTLAAAEGFYSIQPKDQSQGSIKVSYTVQPSGQKAEQSNQKPFSGNGDILCRAELKDPSFTACYNKPQTVTLETELSLGIKQAAGGQSMMQLDASRTKTSLKWNWQFQSCENFWDQKWFTGSYRAADGSQHQVRIFFDLTGGRLEDNGAVYKLEGVAYGNDGLQVSARWSIEEFKSGYFSLNMENVRSGRVKGQWGDTNGFQSAWSGQYEDPAKAAKRDYYAFHLSDFSKCLDAGSALVEGKSCKYDENQLFYVQNIGQSPYFYIRSQISGKCLVPNSGSASAFLASRGCGESQLDTWEFYPRGQSTFRLRNKGSGLCLAIDDFATGMAGCDTPQASYLSWSRR